MGLIMSSLITWFSNEGYTYCRGEDKPFLLVHIDGEYGRLTCIVQALEPQEQVVMCTLFPVRIPEQQRQRMAEYVARANMCQVIGSFDFDFDDGLLAFRTSLEVAGASLTPALIRPLFTHAVSTADRHVPGVMALLFGNAMPVDALDRIERFSVQDVVTLANQLLED